MKNESILYTKSLKEQVYDYLRDEMAKKNLQAGSVINMDATSRKLGISKTPLRDALLQLEMEGFVTIAPRRGIYVNGLTMEDISEFYQVIGALEHSAIIAGYANFKKSHFNKMHRLIKEMYKALSAEQFNVLYQKNLEFHSVYINLSKNEELTKIVANMKKRLYELPAQDEWIKEWEDDSMKEHETILKLLEEEKPMEAANYVRDVHWGYAYQERYIKTYYQT